MFLDLKNSKVSRISHFHPNCNTILPNRNVIECRKFGIVPSFLLVDICLGRKQQFEILSIRANQLKDTNIIENFFDYYLYCADAKLKFKVIAHYSTTFPKWLRSAELNYAPQKSTNRRNDSLMKPMKWVVTPTTIEILWQRRVSISQWARVHSKHVFLTINRPSTSYINFFNIVSNINLFAKQLDILNNRQPQLNA